jgi:hypothetical protein
VAVVQYTFTHKQYTERQKETNNTKNKYIEQHKNVNIKEAEVVNGLQCLDKIAEENAFTSYKINT